MSAAAFRVAVTRDEGFDGPLAEALRRRGCEPVACAVVDDAPTPEPERLAAAAQALETYDWLVVASQRSVTALIEARGGRLLPGALRTAAVGEKTAARLVAAGATSPVTATVAGAAALIEALRGTDRWSGRRVLVPRALEGGRELGEALRGWGASVDEVVAYRTLERAPEAIAAVWREARPEAAVVASPSAARALVRAVGAETLKRLARVVAIGSTTAKELAALGVPAVAPARADFEAVADLLVGTAAQPSTEASR